MLRVHEGFIHQRGERKMIEIGRVCIKIAGREAGKKCAVVDVIDDNYVLIDGDVRRKRCNVKHLEPLEEVIKIEKNASHDTIVSELKKLGVDVKEKKAKEKKEKPKRVKKTAEAKEEKPKKKVKEKKEKKAEEKKAVKAKKK